MEELVESFKNTYDSDTAYDTVAQAGDIVVDALIDDGVLDGVPIISTLKGLYKATKNYQFYRLMKKMHKFILSPMALRCKNVKNSSQNMRKKIKRMVVRHYLLYWSD